MASEDGALVLVTQTPLPEMTLNVYNVNGFACSVIATAKLTVWELKTLLKCRLQIPDEI